MVKMAVYIIEHLEPRLWEWCIIEYRHISKLVGRNNLWFTNITNKTDAQKLGKYGKVIRKSVSYIDLKNACLLDPKASKTLNHNEARHFDYFIFGGILGDSPAQSRTKKFLTNKIKKASSRNLGKAQLSTDNAVYVTKEIVKGKELKDVKFKDNIEIRINDVESTTLPYRFVVVKNKPFISKELARYLKDKKAF